MRILLVEDDPKTASFVTKGLREAGFATDHAKDGEDGLHMALNVPYDTAIIDIMLPKMDGLAVCNALRNNGHCAGKKVPIIILSSVRAPVSDKEVVA